MKQFEAFVGGLLHGLHLAKPLLIELCLFAICAVEIVKFFLAAIQ